MLCKLRLGQRFDIEPKPRAGTTWTDSVLVIVDERPRQGDRFHMIYGVFRVTGNPHQFTVNHHTGETTLLVDGTMEAVSEKATRNQPDIKRPDWPREVPYS